MVAYAELDFKHEASNSERCRANLEAPQSGVRERVAVPAVDHARTSHRVITMEFIEGEHAMGACGGAGAGLMRVVVYAIVGGVCLLLGPEKCVVGCL